MNECILQPVPFSNRHRSTPIHDLARECNHDIVPNSVGTSINMHHTMRQTGSLSSLCWFCVCKRCCGTGKGTVSVTVLQFQSCMSCKHLSKLIWQVAQASYQIVKHQMPPGLAHAVSFQFCHDEQQQDASGVKAADAAAAAAAVQGGS